MNKPLRRVSIFCLALILALMGWTNYLQIVKADEYANHKKNARVAYERYAHPRGNIIVGGKPVTGSTRKQAEDSISEYKWKRTYKNGPLYAPITGYSSQIFGSDKLENLEDGILTGTDDRLFFRRTLDIVTGEERKGGSVVTTIDPKVQKVAYDKLQGKKGAAVAIEPSTGKILGLVSVPSYDPNKVAGSDPQSSKDYKDLLADPNRPMTNRALKETYAPGSVFKVVTAAAALEAGKYSSAGDKTKTPKSWTLPQSRTPLDNDSPFLPCKNATLKMALMVSCNTVFGKMGYELGNKAMAEQAEKFGFNKDDIRIPVGPVESVFPTTTKVKDPKTGKISDVPLNGGQTALSSIGQFDTRTTPLQMAMVAAGIANNGKVMKPYLVDKLQAQNLSVIEQTDPQEYSQAVSEDNAAILQDMMEGVVQEVGGTGVNGRIPGATVGGKTGTAQRGPNNSKKPYAWFISYAKTDGDAKVAVAVVVEDSTDGRESTSGGRLAAPIAKAIMEAVIKK
jgi:cell division protein FtsI/penicillin-binding protein 2